jgi:peptidoglycan-associated lipoprotein
MKRFCFLLLVIVLASFGCQKREITRPEAESESQQQKGQPEAKAPEKVTERQITSQVESVETGGKVSKSTEEKEGIFKDIYFEFDKYDVHDTFKPILKSISAWMIKKTGVKLSIEGHCDTRGTTEYNLALGDRRTKAVKDYLVSLGVPSSRIETISYGSEKPVCTEQTEECWAKNRRAHFVVLHAEGK